MVLLFLTKDEPKMTHHNNPKSTALWFTLGAGHFLDLTRCIMIYTYHYSFIQGSFTTLKNSLLSTHKQETKSLDTHGRHLLFLPAWCPSPSFDRALFFGDYLVPIPCGPGENWQVSWESQGRKRGHCHPGDRHRENLLVPTIGFPELPDSCASCSLTVQQVFGFWDQAYLLLAVQELQQSFLGPSLSPLRGLAAFC